MHVAELLRAASFSLIGSRHFETKRRGSIESRVGIFCSSRALEVLVEWRNISYSVTEKKKGQGHVKKPILSNVSGFAEPGTLTAILGGSLLGSDRKSVRIDAPTCPSPRSPVMYT